MSEGSAKAAAFVGPGPAEVAFEVNGRQVALRVPPHRTLLDALRGECGLTGTKKVCDEGTCGACTVLVNGRATYSCMTLAHMCAGRRVETIEGISNGPGELHPLQRAFIEQDAYQCGFCTPGQIMSLVGLLRANAAPSVDDVTRAVTGNLCRCGAYPNIVAAGMAAARELSGRRASASVKRNKKG